MELGKIRHIKQKIKSFELHETNGSKNPKN